MERLPGLTAKFDSIPQPMAETLAKWLVSPLEPEEWLMAQRVVPDFVKWPRAVLAISDQVLESNAPTDQILTMFSILTGQPWNGTPEDDWKAQMSFDLLQLTHEAFSTDEVDPSSSTSDWVRLEKFLQSAYYERSRLLGSTDLENRSTVENAKQCAKTMFSDASSAERAIGLIELTASNEIEQVVLYLQLINGERHEGDPESSGKQLFRTELRLLEQWNQRRERQLEELVGESI
jgi:hypothetical protein